MECRERQMKLTKEIKELEEETNIKTKKLNDIKEIFINGRIVSRVVEKKDELDKINKIRDEIFGEVGDDSEYDDFEYYNIIVLGINSKFLEKYKYGENNLKKKILLNKLKKLEHQIEGQNKIMSGEDFLAKKYMKSISYDEDINRAVEIKKQKVLNENKTERTHLEYIISIYEGEIGLLKLEEHKRDILKKNIEEMKILRDEKDMKLSKMVELYNNTIEMCKSKCNIKNDLNIKKMGIILGTDYLNKKNLNKEFIKNVLNNKKCCRKDLIDINDILKNKCNLIGGTICDLKYLSDKKRMLIQLNDNYDNEMEIYKIPERKLEEDSENDLVNAKIKIMIDFHNKQIKELKKYRYVDLQLAESTVLNCIDENKSKEDELLCEFRNEQRDKLELLKQKYKEYYKKYGCINKSLMRNDAISNKYMKKCSKDFKIEVKKEKDELVKIINDLEKKNKYINNILEKINKQLSLYDEKSRDFVCNKKLAMYGKSFLNIMEELYKKCLC